MTSSLLRSEDSALLFCANSTGKHCVGLVSAFHRPVIRSRTAELGISPRRPGQEASRKPVTGLAAAVEWSETRIECYSRIARHALPAEREARERSTLRSQARLWADF